jgi:hypothetical protein
MAARAWRAVHREGGVNRIYHAGSREQGVRVDIDLIRALSDRARTTRKPGQTLQSRLNELRQECEA